jgi:hypothetical protein
MAANEGWYSQWFANGWFPSVWFAPGDESGVPVEELRQEYRGGTGRMLPARDPFADADLEQIVRDKWEAIERATDKDSLPVSKDHFRDATKKIDATPAHGSEDATETDFGSIEAPAIGMPAPDSIIARHYGPIQAADTMTAALIERARIERRQREEEEALILMLLAD